MKAPGTGCLSRVGDRANIHAKHWGKLQLTSELHSAHSSPLLTDAKTDNKVGPAYSVPSIMNFEAFVFRHIRFAAVLFLLSRPVIAQTVQYDGSRAGLIERLKGSVVSEDGGLATPTRLIVVGEQLVVLDRGADKVIRVYDVGSGRLHAAFGRHGQGPGEFSGAWELLPGIAPRSVWVLDVSLRRVTALNLDSLVLPRGYRGDAMVTLSGEGSLESLQLLSGRGFIGTGTFARGRLAHYSSTGGFLRTVGTPPRGDRRWSSVVAQDAFSARLGVHQVTNRVVVAYRWTDRLEVLDPEGTLLTTMERPLGFEPVVSSKSDFRAAFTLDSRHAYLSTASSGRHVYSLFSGRTEREAGKAMSFGRDVLVFSFDGKIRRILRLDADVIAMAVDESEAEIFALAHDPHPRILRFKIPKLPDTP